MAYKIFMEIEGIQGSEKIGTFSGQIEIEHYEFGVRRNLRSNTLGNGRNKEFGVPQISTISIKKHFDSSSTKIISSALLSKGKNVTIRVFKNAGEKNDHVVKTLKLSNCVLTNYHVSASDEFGIEEEIDINFSKFNIDHKPVTSDGKPAGNPTSIGYDSVKVKKL